MAYWVSVRHTKKVLFEGLGALLDGMRRARVGRMVVMVVMVEVRGVIHAIQLFARGTSACLR